MEDPLGQARTLLYRRMLLHSDGAAEGDLDSLFTRPAPLAIAEGERKGAPVRALNKACRMLLRILPSAEGSEDGVHDAELNNIAASCGFASTEGLYQIRLNHSEPGNSTPALSNS